MDAIVIALARQAGQALVTAMASDAWLAIRDGLTRLYARAGEDRAVEVAEALEDSRDTVLSGRSAPEVVATRWQGRFEALLEVYPEQADGLREVVVQVTSAAGTVPGRLVGIGGGAPAGNTQLVARNTGGGIVWP
ncbi:hypothetical protein ABT344_19045 [Micromonospora carbonacea]|uniref:hypothetical protein n=1 Tax=Micromonospora carbonacea TaxID=47853 RepID=UPI0033165FD1